MAQTKVIIIDVQTEEGRKELEKLRKEFENVEDQAKKTDKSVDDVASNGGAIAILDQLTGGLATRLRDAYEASKLFNVSLKATRGALIATGIGAFVVALGTIVVLWDDIIAAIEDVNGKLDEQLELTNKIQDTLNLEITLLDKRIELSTKQGKANEELQKQRIELVKLLQREQEEETALLEKKVANIKASAIELNTREKILKTVLNIASFGAGDAYILEQRQEALKEIEALEDLILKSKTEQVDINAKLFDLENPDSKDKKDTSKKDEIDPLDKLFAELEAETLVGLESNQRAFDRERARLQGILDIQGEYQELTKIQTLQAQEQLALEELDALFATEQQKASVKAYFAKQIADEEERIAKEQSENEIKWADLTAEAKLGIAQSALAGVAGLVDEQSVAGKGIAIAQTGINTAQGIMQAFATLPTIPAIVAAALVGATGILQTQKIISQKIPSATGRGFVSGGNSGASTAQAPAFNLVQGTEGNQISEDVQGLAQEPVRAVVVSGDVTTAQSVDRNIETESGI